MKLDLTACILQEKKEKKEWQERTEIKELSTDCHCSLITSASKGEGEKAGEGKKGR